MSDDKESRPDSSGIQEHLSRFVAELSPILEHLASRVLEHDDRITRHEDYFNGISDAHKKSQINDLKTAHSSRFGDILSKLEGVHKALGRSETSEDFWPALHDKMRELEIGDDTRDSFLDHVFNHLTKTHDSIYAPSPAAMSSDVGSGEVPNAEVTIEASGEPEAVTEAIDQGSKKVKEATKEAKPEPKKKEPPAVGSKEFYDSLGGNPPKARK